MTIRKIFILTLLAATAVAARAAMTADQVLAKVASALTTPPSVSVTFTFSGNGQAGEGAMTVCRNLFTYNAQDLAVWYDGANQWALQRSAGEVTVTEPTAEELIESNPFSIITGYRQHFTGKLLSAPKGMYKIELTAKRRHQAIRSAIITVNAKTFVPELIEATMGQNVKTTVRVKSFIKGKALPKTFFQFNPKLNPKVRINDLR